MINREIPGCYIYIYNIYFFPNLLSLRGITESFFFSFLFLKPKFLCNQKKILFHVHLSLGGTTFQIFSELFRSFQNFCNFCPRSDSLPKDFNLVNTL